MNSKQSEKQELLPEQKQVIEPTQPTQSPPNQNQIQENQEANAEAAAFNQFWINPLLQVYNELVHTFQQINNNDMNHCKAQIKQKDPNKQFAEQIIKYDTKNVAPYIWFALNSSDSHQIINWYNKVLEIRPDIYRVYNGLGLANNGIGNYEESIRCCKICIEHLPNFQYVYNNLGNSYERLGKHHQAIEAYKKCIQIDAQYSKAYNGLGICYKSLHMLDQAIESYKKSIELDPWDHFPLNSLANAYKDIGEVKLAEETYLKAIKVNSKYASPYNGLALLYKDSQNLCQAVKMFKRSIEVSGNNDPLGRINLGQLYIQQSNFVQAFECFERAGQDLQKENDLTKHMNTYLENVVLKFKAESELWNFRLKIAYSNEEEKKRHQDLKEQFLNKANGRLDSHKSTFLKRLATLNISSQQIPTQLEQLLKQNQISDLVALASKLLKENENQHIYLITQLLYQIFWPKNFKKTLHFSQIQNLLRYSAQQFCSILPSNQNTTKSETKFLKEVEKISNVFGQFQYFPTFQVLFTEIEKANNRIKYILPSFRDIVEEISAENKGIRTEIKCKIPENEDTLFGVLFEISEEIFKKEFSDSQKQTQIKERIDETLKKEITFSMKDIVSLVLKVWIDEINTLLKDKITNQVPTRYQPTDLITATVIFKNLQDLREAALAMQKECSAKQYSIIATKNQQSSVQFQISFQGIIGELSFVVECCQIAKFQKELAGVVNSLFGLTLSTYFLLSRWLNTTLMNKKQIKIADE